MAHHVESVHMGWDGIFKKHWGVFYSGSCLQRTIKVKVILLTGAASVQQVQIRPWTGEHTKAKVSHNSRNVSNIIKMFEMRLNYF